MAGWLQVVTNRDWPWKSRDTDSVPESVYTHNSRWLLAVESLNERITCENIGQTTCIRESVSLSEANGARAHRGVLVAFPDMRWRQWADSILISGKIIEQIAVQI